MIYGDKQPSVAFTTTSNIQRKYNIVRDVRRFLTAVKSITVLRLQQGVLFICDVFASVEANVRMPLYS